MAQAQKPRALSEEELDALRKLRVLSDEQLEALRKHGELSEEVLGVLKWYASRYGSMTADAHLDRAVAQREFGRWVKDKDGKHVRVEPSSGFIPIS